MVEFSTDSDYEYRCWASFEAFRALPGEFILKNIRNKYGHFMRVRHRRVVVDDYGEFDFGPGRLTFNYESHSFGAHRNACQLFRCKSRESSLNLELESPTRKRLDHATCELESLVDRLCSEDRNELSNLSGVLWRARSCYNQYECYNRGTAVVVFQSGPILQYGQDDGPRRSLSYARGD